MDSSNKFSPIVARTMIVRHPVGPVAFDCVKIIFIRAGSALLYSEFGERTVRPGNVVILAAHTLCGSEPEETITVTTLYLDRIYLVDQVYWQHAPMLSDRLEAQDFMDVRYTEPAQILDVGRPGTEHVAPWLDELVMLSSGNSSRERFYRMQSLLFAVLDVIIPFVKVTNVRQTAT